MRVSKCLLGRLPAGTKYVLESHGPIVRRYVEFPNGQRVTLAKRRAVLCTCRKHEALGRLPAQDVRSDAMLLVTLSKRHHARHLKA